MSSRLTIIAVLVLVAAGCGGGFEEQTGHDSEVVVYTSVDDVFARPVAADFTNRTGTVVRLVTDTEETKSTGLLNRLLAEKQRPQADVFWSGDPVRAAILKRHKVAAPYRSPAAEGLPPEFSDPEGFWTGFSTRARVLIYNTDLITEAEAPNSVFDLVDPRFGGSACMANPLFGTTSMHAAALFSILGEVGATEFFENFLTNGGRVLSSNGEVRRRVSSGEFALGITDTDDANVARLEGSPIAVVFPDFEGIGTLLVPNCAVLINGAPHPKAGREFIDFLLSPQTESALANSEAAQIPLRPGVSVPEGMVAREEIQPMDVKYGELSELLESLSAGYLKEWVAR
ncbi:MAG: extracellular solute-binding protein [bacterium]|nr:extracellular solute-binding protein [bacterium]